MQTDSEFACDVVRVTGVAAHPGADRLELVRFTLDGSLDYPDLIVCGKGDLRAGDLAVYISPDASVPLATERFAFLKKRLDGGGKDRYRIRSARIRGVYSPGLLLPCDPTLSDVARVGDSVAEVWGVIPHRTAVDGAQPLQSGSPAKRRSCPHPEYTVESIKKCPHLFKAGEFVSITEKLHGTSFRFGMVGGRFFYGSHRVQLSDDRGWLRRAIDWLLRRAPTQRESVWSRAVEQFDLARRCAAAPGLVFYGELYGAKIQDLDYGLSEVGLRIFDVWRVRGNRWLDLYERRKAIEDVGLQAVPQLSVAGYSLDSVKWLAEQPSVHGGIREGVVVESLDLPRRKGKWVSEQYHMRKDA